ncbi:unnamed protein product [Dovyalis caffra]|uniref:Uncharacterized protein n=1 Tax=Dovyalis caffra TaxID=77055 RepID=A0AAV1RPQ8_9ROSI|nr:unnamed protein product [Dovyalis caffra]
MHPTKSLIHRGVSNLDLVTIDVKLKIKATFEERNEEALGSGKKTIPQLEERNEEALGSGKKTIPQRGLLELF